MEKKIRILFVHHATGWGGAPKNLLNIIQHLDPDKYIIRVLFIKYSEAFEIFREEGIDCEVLDGNDNWFAHNSSARTQLRFIYKYFSIYHDWKFVAEKEAREYLKKVDIDILHLNSHVLTSWAYAAKRLNIKVVLHNQETIVSGYLGIRYNILKNLTLNNCDAVINISKDNERRFDIRGKSYVVYNFIDIPSSPLLPMSNGNCIKVLYLGGMSKIKGFKTVVDCLPYLDSRVVLQFGGHISNWKSGNGFFQVLKSAGKLILYSNLYQPLRILYKSKNVEVLGLLKNPLKEINDCDILISPFDVAHFSRPLIEAMAYGKAVISSDVEGMTEIIDSNINGLIVAKQNPRALAEAINKFCDNPQMAVEMGKRARKKAIEFFSPQANMPMLEDIYEQLVEK